MLRLLIISFFSLFYIVAFAQDEERFPRDSVPEIKKNARGLTEKEAFVPLKMVYFYADNPDKTYSIRDTSLHTFFHEYNPARNRAIDYANLGNLGTPAHALEFQSADVRGFDIGMHQFDLYKHDFRKVKYHQINKTFTDLFYSQGALQDEFILNAQFTRNIGEQSNLSVDYTRISHEGQYLNQKSRHTAFSINNWYKSKSAKYKNFLSFTLNDIQQEDNGGITQFDLFRDPQGIYDNRQNIPIALATAFTTQKEQVLSMTQYLSFSKTIPDSLLIIPRQFTASHQFVYRTNKNLFTDSSLAQDSSFYKHFQVDNRGLRHFIKGYSIENSVNIATFKPTSKNQVSKSQSDWLTLGITHIYNNYNQEPIDTIVNNLFLTGKWTYNLKETIQLDANARLGLWDQAGDYQIKAELNWQTKKLGQLQLAFTNQLYTPSLITQKAFITQQEIWNNNFDKVLETSIIGQYNLPSFDLTLLAKSHLINNYIYYDDLGYPRQTSTGLGILQLGIYKGLSFGRFFHLNNWVTFQQPTNTDIIRLPRIFSKHSLYFEGHLAQKIVFAKLGFDFRFNTPYKANAYQPLTGQFYLQNDKQIPFYPLTDVFLDFKVKRFRAFVKMENILDWVFSDATYEPYYTTPSQPNPDGTLRFDTFRMGISWQFED